MRRTASLLLTFALATASVLGHEGHHGAPPPETAAESFWNLVTAVVLVAIALLYAAGLRRLWGTAAGRESVHRWHVLAFAAGWSSLLLALLSQLDRWSDALFSAHMAQHEVLMLVSAPLMVLGRPFVVTLWALSAPARGKAALVLHRRSVTAAWELLSGPLAILILHAAVLGAWHVPSLFEAALHHEAIHVVQHLTFFLTAALFWWSLIHGRYGRLGYGIAVLYVFATAMFSELLGALFTFGSRVWYPTHAARTTAAGFSPIHDQELAGIVMWIPFGLVFLIVALALFAAWLGEANRRVAFTRADRTRHQAP